MPPRPSTARSGARTDLSAAEARRIALAAQGFGRPRPTTRITARHFQRVLQHTGLVQIDSVNVLARAHYMPYFSRLGPYDTTALDRFTWNSGRMFEYWGHAASLIPVERYPLFHHRTSHSRQARWALPYLHTNRTHADELIAHIREHGAVVVGDVNDEGTTAGWWEWSKAKTTLEALHISGELAIGQRRGFARLYNLPERVLPPELLEAEHPDVDEAERELLRLALRHHGIGTARDLADYYRVPVPSAKRHLRELVDGGEAQPVTVQGWTEPAYLQPNSSIPRRIEARALLSPFDPVAWERDRILRLFDFAYRIEIYTPEAQRQYGYYVLPFLLGDQLVGRVDLKADRARSTLLVRASHIEDGHDHTEVAGALAAELQNVATWLGLETLAVESRGGLSQALKRVV